MSPLRPRSGAAAATRLHHRPAGRVCPRLYAESLSPTRSQWV